jgi:hypothetical protein
MNVKNNSKLIGTHPLLITLKETLKIIINKKTDGRMNR